MKYLLLSTISRTRARARQVERDGSSSGAVIMMTWALMTRFRPQA